MLLASDLKVGACEVIDETTACPQCGQRIPVDPAWVTWCEACGWNADPDPPRLPSDPKSAGRLDAGQQRLLRTADEMITGPTRRRWSGQLIACYVVGLAVVLSSVALLAGCLWWMKSVRPNPFALLVASAGLMVAWGLRPRLGRISRDAVRVRRADSPRLYALLDDVAEALSAGRVSVVILSPAFNASYARVGFRRRRVVVLGMPLWHALGPSERVALVAHELAHDVNHDVRRSYLPAMAITTLSEWESMLSPGHMPLSPYGSPLPFVAGGDAASRGLMGVAARAARGIRRLELRLTMERTQLAEYLADELAAGVAGARAVVGLLSTLLDSASANRIIRESASLSVDDLSMEVRSRPQVVPDRERRRLRQVSRQRLDRIDSSHPPTALRMDVIEGRLAHPPRVRLTDHEAAAIDEELRTAILRIPVRRRR